MNKAEEVKFDPKFFFLKKKTTPGSWVVGDLVTAEDNSYINLKSIARIKYDIDG